MNLAPEITLPENSSAENLTQTKLFSDILPEGLLLNKMAELGFSTPTDIQSLSMQKALEGHDLILKAKTGSGKTLAFVLPFIQRFTELGKNKNETAALFIAPTRELAVQIQEVIQKFAPELSPVVVIGGVDEKKQKNALERDARIIVGTPGRLQDLIQKKIINLKTCKYFVLDEADEMLSMGFIEAIRTILSKLPKERQGLFVSATITPRVEMLAHNFLQKYEYILAESKDDDAPAIEHLYCEVGGELLSKSKALCDIIETQNPRSAIIFCNTKSETEFVELVLRRRGFDARRMNSDLSQSQRQKVIAKIKAYELHLLVATDIAARGIDISELDLVIHYSLHDQPETYVHRTGRTGRAGHKGRSISIIGPKEYGAFHYLKKVISADFQKIELYSDEDVANARLTLLYKKLRENEEKLETRNLLSAKKLLEDHGIMDHTNEELIEIIGRLLEFTLAHSVAEETRSLDEELQHQSERDSKKDHKPSSKGHSKKKDSRQRNSKEASSTKRESTQKESNKNHRASKETFNEISSTKRSDDKRKTHKKRGRSGA